MNQHTLIIGGAKSGKSSHALQLAEEMSPRRVFIATAEARDQEMTLRIARHQAERGPTWRTVEEPLDLVGALNGVDDPAAVVVVDCLTLWLGNLLTRAELDAEAVQKHCEDLAAALPKISSRVILVSNEVGLGIVPDNALARSFRDLAGNLNQNLARVCQRVILITAGIPLMLKGG
jgi:adenosylcobinamide kinase/adenosylcobinamide-phosphate guanylyltransferase